MAANLNTRQNLVVNISKTGTSWFSISFKIDDNPNETKLETSFDPNQEPLFKRLFWFIFEFSTLVSEFRFNLKESLFEDGIKERSVAVFTPEIRDSPSSVTSLCYYAPLKSVGF